MRSRLFRFAWSRPRHCATRGRASGLLARLALVCMIFGVAASCAEERAPINRVQAMALSKHFFVGANLSDPSDDPEFYMGNRIIDEPYGVGQGFWMYQSIGSLARIKWEIQETVLIARLTYERIQNSDYHGSQTTNDGQVVAEFNITSQFDIVRDYNPQTGEQLNLVVENTTDRPWYEREYFRVDWSTNLVTDAYDFDMFALGAGLDGLKYDPLSYTYEDPSDPNAPVYDDANGYLDVTTKVFATPQVVQTPYGGLPLCFLFGNYPAVTCNPAEVTVRLSFKKVVDDDFEPEDWDGNKMNAFGYFTVDRFGYDRNYGIVDQEWHRFATKYNIWRKSHVDGTQCAVDAWRDANGNVQNYRVDSSGQYAYDGNGLPIPDPKGQPFTKSAVGQDVHRDTDKDGTEDECEFKDPSGNVVNPGSRCDEFTNKCDIPLYDRTTKTTALYYGPGSAPDLFATTAQALNEWNIAVKRAVQLGKQVEATRVNIDAGQASFLTSEADLIADQQGAKTVPDIFVLCHNPVAAGDSPACGAPGLAVRLGDLRYNVVNIITDPQLPSAWGIMTDFDDPLTGEKVQASINEWEAVLDIASQNVEDLLRWINGEINNSQIANGQYMQQWLQASSLGSAQYTPAVLSAKEIQSRLNSVDRSSAKLNGLTAGSTLPTWATQQTAAQNLSSSLGPALDANFQSATQLTLGSKWETQLITPNVLQMAGLNPTQPFAGDATTLGLASPLRGLDPRLMKWSRGILTAAQTYKDMCVLNDLPEPDSLVGLARQAAKLFPLPAQTDPNYPAEAFDRDQSLHEWIRQQFHLSVIAHEMGHSMGLRHNFTGSFDALNYHTEYWQLRTRNGAEHYCGFPSAQLDATTPHTNGTDCVGPRWVDPVTVQETDEAIWKWGSSTVMDYPGDPTQDTNDIGLYDKAAMRFGYADIVDVEQNMKYVAQSDGTAAGSGIDYLRQLDGFGGILGRSVGGHHYSMYNDLYGVLGKCTPRAGWTGAANDPLAMECSGANLAYSAERDMRTVDQFNPAITAASPQNVANFAVDPQNRVRHPYMFGSDEFADTGNVPVFRFDAGADSYEQMQFLISTYENRYIFNNFRRNQVLFNTGSVVDRIRDRYWDKIQGISKSFALGIELETRPGADPTTDPGDLMPIALGSADAFSMFARAITRPNPGTYVVTPASAGGAPSPWGRVWALGDPSAPNAPPMSLINVALGNGQGRYSYNNYDYTQGYWWSEYQTQVGSYYEKLAAFEYLLQAYNDFVSNSPQDYIDGRYKNLNYASLYPDQVRRLLANTMVAQSPLGTLDQGTTAQIFTVAPYSMPGVSTLANGNPLTDVQYLPWDKFDPNDPATTSLTYPAGAVLLDPQLGWEEQYWGLLLQFFYGRTTLTQDYIDQLRIFSPGDAASLSIQPAQEVAYRDPATGIEYVAKNYGTETINGITTAKSVGSRMIQYANLLAQQAYAVASTATNGELAYTADAQGNAVPLTSQAAQDAATMLKSFTSNIDVVRQLTLFFGYGPL
jgi:hypothetical protein